MNAAKLKTSAVFLAICLGSILLSGCISPRDQVAVVRGAKFARAEGSTLGRAVAGELGQVAADIGAVTLGPDGEMLPGDVDPAAVPLEAAAAEANAQGIAAEREARNWFLSAASAALNWGKTQWPALGVIISLAGGAAALWKKLRGSGQALVSAQGAVTAGVTIIQRAKEALADGKLTLSDFKTLFEQARTAGPAFVDGAHALDAAYQDLKAEWAGTQVRSVGGPPAAAN